MLTPLRRLVGTTFTGLAVAFTAGCSGQRPATPATSATPAAVAIQAGAHARSDGSLYFRERVLRVPAGQVSILFTNPAALEHNVAVRKNGERLGITATVADGASARLNLHLQPGRYVFFCAIPGHEATGMRGTLIVT